MHPQQYKDELMTRLQAAGESFYDVEKWYRFENRLEKNNLDKQQELLGKALDMMPVFGEAIAVLDSVPPRVLTDLVEKNIVHGSIVYQEQALGFFIGRIEVPKTRLADSLKLYFLMYLRGELSVEKERILLTNPYTFENFKRTCFSARDVCKEVDSIDTRF